MAFSVHGESGKFQRGKHVKKLVKEEVNIIASSDPAAGAANVSADGSQFQINLQEGLKIPADAHNVQVSLQEASIWNSIPNINAGVNDKLYILCPRATDDALTNYVITVPTGLYGVTALNKTVLRELANAGAKIDPSSVIKIIADDATQKVELRFNYVGIEVDFTPADTFRDILGFNSQVIGPNATAPFIYLAPNVASFNSINSFLIHSDLVSRGIRINTDYAQILGQVLIDVKPGSQITSKPFNPPRIAADELAGQIKSTIRFWVTDEVGLPINTNGEAFTARVSISYYHGVWV